MSPEITGSGEHEVNRGGKATWNSSRLTCTHPVAGKQQNRDRLAILRMDRKLGSEVDVLPKNEVHTQFS